MDEQKGKQRGEQKTSWKRAAAGLLCGLVVSAGAAQAAEPSFRPLLGGGLTIGGDKFIEDIRFDNGDTEDIQAGQLLQIYGGFEYQAVPQFSVQGTIGYHIDSSQRASNGSAKFERYPLELLGHFHVDEKLRVGGGVRFVTGARFTSSGFLSSGNFSFDNTVGAVVEAEYLLAPQLGLKLRYVSEKYQTRGSEQFKFDGSHIGLMANWYL